MLARVRVRDGSGVKVMAVKTERQGEPERWCKEKWSGFGKWGKRGVEDGPALLVRGAGVSVPWPWSTVVRDGHRGLTSTARGCGVGDSARAG